MVLEVCVESVDAALAATAGGADRLELCSALNEGGITPSIGFIRAVRRSTPATLFPIIRPRGGDFTYSSAEVALMLDDIAAARAEGADGVVLGVLKADGHVDVSATRMLIAAARPMQVTFHRAFDVTVDLDQALEDVIATGADRLLTSGGAADAVQGTARIAQLHRHAQGRIIVMPGGGLRQHNVGPLVQATAVREVHASLSQWLPSPATLGNPDVQITARNGDATRRVVDPQTVRAFRNVLDTLNPPPPVR